MLAGLALYLQLAFASWGALATQAEPVDALAEHALCLATQDGSSQPAASVARLGLGEATFTPGPRHSPANARAPPTLA